MMMQDKTFVSIANQILTIAPCDKKSTLYCKESDEVIFVSVLAVSLDHTIKVN